MVIFFYNDGMVMFFSQGTIAINGFSMVFPNSGAMVSDGFDLEKDLQMHIFLFEI